MLKMIQTIATIFSNSRITSIKRGAIMEVFNIIVGVFTIIGSIASVFSLFVLRNISNQQKNNGSQNSNQNQSNRGTQNQNTIIH